VLTHWLRQRLFPDAAWVHLSLPAFAGWVGAFITGLNLLPLSQLDGGHVLYGLLGKNQRLVTGAVVLALLVLALRSPNWFVWVALTFVIGGGRWTHPTVMVPARPVPSSRRWVGFACIVVFALTFVPYPFAQ
jgi:membrane-associated protease RseP (regulator of RpoE activity)